LNKLKTRAAAAGKNTLIAYDDYKMQIAQKYIHILAIVAAVLNLVLIVPDWLLIESITIRLVVASVRILYAGLLVFVSVRAKKAKAFQPFSLLVAFSEALALLIFLFVMTRYSRFNFLIQAMGYIAFVLFVFIVPNRTQYTLTLTVLGAAGFFVCAHLFQGSVDDNEFLAALVYIPLAIVLCTISAAGTERHQFREYIAKSRLEHLSSTDFLTDTANRFLLEEEAGRWMDFCRRQDMPLSLAFIDVDNLKSINDRYGHQTGDSVLVDLARLFQRQLRSSDTLARWGGDEFVLLLPNTQLQGAVQLMERIKASVEDDSFVAKTLITWSCGVVEMQQRDGFHNMLRVADSLMYEGKHRGKNLICYRDGDGLHIASGLTGESEDEIF
jgi:diguanylate cyclase (GGDEF)-like protein